MPLIGTREALREVQRINEFIVVHKEGLEGWAEEQGEWLRGMLRHVQQKAIMKQPPKWYLAMHLDEQDVEAPQPAVRAKAAKALSADFEDKLGDELEEEFGLAKAARKTKRPIRLSSHMSHDVSVRPLL